MKGQRVFITGGASGLGRALAEHYARNGGRIGIGDLNDARGAETLSALRALGGEAFYIHCDVRSEADLISAREQMVEQFGGVDLLFNNAGVAQRGDRKSAVWGKRVYVSVGTGGGRHIK